MSIFLSIYDMSILLISDVSIFTDIQYVDIFGWYTMCRFLGDIRNVDFWQYPICWFWRYPICWYFWGYPICRFFFRYPISRFWRFVDFDDTRYVDFCQYLICRYFWRYPICRYFCRYLICRFLPIYDMTILADIRYADIFADIWYVDILPIYDMLVFADIRYVNILSISDADTNIFYFTLLGINSKS